MCVYDQHYNNNPKALPFACLLWWLIKASEMHVKYKVGIIISSRRIIIIIIMILLHVDDLLTGMIWKRVRYAVSKRSFNCTHTQRISFIWFGLFSSADAKKWTEACCVCAAAEERASTERLEVFLHLWVQTNIKHGKILEYVFWFVVLLLVLMFVDCLVHIASFFRAVVKIKNTYLKNW